MKKTPVFRAIAIRVCTLVFACWFCLSGLLTWAVAAEMRRGMENSVFQQVHAITGFREGHTVAGNTDGLPGAMEVNTLSYLPYLYYHLGNLDSQLPVVMDAMPSSYGRDVWYDGKNDLLYGFEPAAVFYDETGEIFASSRDFISFAYTTEENWKVNPTQPIGMGYIDVSALGDIQKLDRVLEVNAGHQSFADMTYPHMTLNGYFEGARFYPSVIDVRFTGGSWETMYVLPPDGSIEPQKFYAWDIWAYSYDYDEVRFRGNTYDSLTDLIEQNPECAREGNLWETVIVQPSPQKEDDYGTYSYVLAVRCWPLPYALLRLLPFYLISAVLIGIALFLILRRVRINYIAPVKELKIALDYGTTVQPAASWSEVHALETYFAQSRQEAAEAKSKLQQLQTALDYAKDAEEKRRQLISNITHELKTPLAVIHSYAEALQSDIAEEKRSQYLSVVLEETEQMDAMVLQMLDLSRLEAGKVSLASDQFSLLQLTRQIAEKFAPLMAEKKLRLTFVQAEEFLIVADIQRIGQVLTNFLSNAVKYTAVEGEIKLYVSADRNGAHFSIENTVEKPLPQEAVSKVWDSFYRVDPSRSEPGTGLGLTIVKQIITLHGGTCKVHNKSYQTSNGTQFGVVFGFTLPHN